MLKSFTKSQEKSGVHEHLCATLVLRLRCGSTCRTIDKVSIKAKVRNNFGSDEKKGTRVDEPPNQKILPRYLPGRQR